MISSAVVGASATNIMRVGQATDKFGTRRGFTSGAGSFRFIQVGQDTVAEEIATNTGTSYSSGLHLQDSVVGWGNLKNVGYSGDAISGIYQAVRFGSQKYLITAFHHFIVTTTFSMARLNDNNQLIFTDEDNSTIAQDVFTSITTDEGTFLTADANVGSLGQQYTDYGGSYNGKTVQVTSWTWNFSLGQLTTDGSSTNINQVGNESGTGATSNLGYDNINEESTFDPRQPVIIRE